VRALEEVAHLDALGPGGAFRARRQADITDIRGRTVAQLSLVPPVFVTRAVAEMRRAQPLAPSSRPAALGRAAELFCTAAIGGLELDDYQRLVTAVAGLSIAVIRRSSQAIADACRTAPDTAVRPRPAGALAGPDAADAEVGGAVWARRGAVLGVHAAGNHPAVHCHWLEALALGYSVAVRPSRREPFTAHRLITALRDAGFGPDHVAFLPTDHLGADELLTSADLSIVYGGDGVVQKYRPNPAVLTNGPGRSKILVTADCDWRPHLEMLADSVSHGGGTGCVKTTAIFVEGDPEPLARALAGRLSAIPSLPPEDEDALLPVHSHEDAKRIDEYLAAAAGDAVAVLGGHGVADALPDGSAALRPAVHLLDRPGAPQARIELPFPCVWVCPWTPDAGIEPLKDALVLTVMTTSESLVRELLAEPTIRNLYVGPVPTYWTSPGMPHDDYLGAFLMESKGFISKALV
jgi:acyl-CoA reductase-like NAD-dependent aldehyde dehydrogenase